MMQVRFRGEDEEGNPKVYENWKALASEAPWALIDPDTLLPNKREMLISELKAYASLKPVKNGDERVEMLPDPFSSQNENLIRFASNNLPRLQPEPNQREMAEQEAIAFLRYELKGFDRLHNTFVQHHGKSKRTWRKIEKMREKPIACERLVDLYNLNLAPRLSPIWHAVRLLVFSEMALSALGNKDPEAALQWGIAIGESRKALQTKLAKADSSASGGRQQRPEIAERNRQIAKEAKAMRSRNPKMTDTAIARQIRRKLSLSVSVRTIRNAMKDGR